ncbi:MAG: hypothetical protein AVO38_12760 [delta proteobacterium ML8_D]|nr:MAG: hypothetical protein AVO38_12760 [delta proteobacterium ML8_D]
MYHRILPCEKIGRDIQAGMYVNQVTFKQHLKFLTKYFSIVPIAELPYIFKGRSISSATKPHCVLTFDDGWYDFYEYAYPVLKAENIPATVFVPTDFIGTKDYFWTDRFAALLNKREQLKSSTVRQEPSLNELINEVENLGGSLESRLEKAIAILKNYPINEIENILSELSLRWNISLDQANRAFLTWEEIREMVHSDLVSFGSHTVSHKILTTLTDDEINRELVESKQRLINEQAVDPSFIPFCYPNGNYNKRIAKLVKDVGYSLAVTTKNGWNTVESNPFELKRIPIHQDMTATDAMFGCRIAGIF